MDREQGRLLLQGVRLFRDLTPEAIEGTLDAARRYRVAKGTALFRQDDPPEAFYVLVHGRVKVTQETPDGQSVVVRFIGPGEMLGCVAVCGGAGYPGTATAVEDCILVGWTSKAFSGLMLRHPQLALSALGAVGRRLQETQTRMREMATEKVERRIAHALLRLVRQAGRRVEGGVEIDFPISRQDIAEMTGTTLHTVSRTLSAWEDRGIVAGGRQRVVVRDPHGLVSIAEEL